MAPVTPGFAGDRPVPDILTEIPGPKARAHVAYDEKWTSSSLPRAYPIVPIRGGGVTVEEAPGGGALFRLRLPVEETLTTPSRTSQESGVE